MAPFIVIVGLYAAGKTTLARLIGKSLDFSIFLEEHQKRLYHVDFAQDMHKWAFQNQVDFITAAAETQFHINQSDKPPCLDGCIYEYFHIFTSYLYDHGYLTDRDFAILQRLFYLLESELTPPDLLVVLDIVPSTALNRIEKRARSSDHTIGVDLEFLKEIQGRLEKWIATWPSSKLLRVNTENLNFVNDASARQSIIEELYSCLLNKNMINKSLRESGFS